ncbi:MAG: hypothetical protein ABFC62_01590 [Clostridiaceae bacterium]
MKYSEIMTVLKRYSFEAKMDVLQKHSREIMTLDGILNTKELRGLPLPWHLETFALFSIKAAEWKFDDFYGEHVGKFYDIINCIDKYFHPVLERCKSTNMFADNLFLALSAVQFDIQEFYPYKQYRYNYYFTFCNEKINMPKLFKEKFGCSYNDFLVLAQFLWVLFAENKYYLPQAVLKFILNKFPCAAKQLCISREDYIKELNSITEDSSDYLYCLRPSYTYPFITQKNMLFVPLPHLLMRAATSSLLFRLTEGDNQLTNVLGKEVFESYLHRIISNSQLFDEVIVEQKYKYHKTERRTLDVLTRKGDYYIFFDSKSFTPKRDLRIFSSSASGDEIRRLAESCVQAYKHIRYDFPKLYNPFCEMSPVNPDNVFAIVVTREFPFIRTKHIYDKAAEQIKIDTQSPEYEWLCRHIGIVGIIEIERCCFTHSDMVSRVIDISKNDNPYDFWLIGPTEGNYGSDPEVRAFNDKTLDQILELTDELQQSGLLTEGQ